ILPGLVSELKRWSLMVTVPEDMEIAQIEETLGTVKCLGQVRVRGRMFHQTQNRIMALCECKEKCTDNVPPEVFHLESGTSWPVITLVDAVAPSDFNVKLKTLLEVEGKTMEDIKGLLPDFTPGANTTESILLAVGDILEKSHKPQAEGGYRKLNTSVHPIQTKKL
uniref:Paraneoplastic antigen Ma-like N-terminal domain-containing protein n=1 Tax=Nothobranchius furzeri TaxID=105023 RepID=A0A8C6LEA4_NOTFU